MRTALDDGEGAGDPRAYVASGAPQWGATKKLLWANGIVFVAFLILEYWPAVGGPLAEWLRLDPEQWFRGVPLVWQLWTYGFLHSPNDPWHILFNMLALYFFGTMLEGQVGSRRFVWQYFAALAIGGVVHLLVAALAGRDPLLGAYPPVVGASGAVLYTIVACAVLMPTARVLFFFVPMQLKVMALILVGLDLFNVLHKSARASLVASDVHLAGAAFGFVAARAGWIWFDPDAWWNRRRAQRVRETQASDEQKLDELLARIHREGIQSLSRREKEFLSRMSKRG